MTPQQLAAIQKMVETMKAQAARIQQLERDNASLRAANRLLVETHQDYRKVSR